MSVVNPNIVYQVPVWAQENFYLGNEKRVFFLAKK